MRHYLDLGVDQTIWTSVPSLRRSEAMWMTTLILMRVRGGCASHAVST